MAFDVAKILTELAKKHQKKFLYQDKELPLEQVFALDGALFILVKRANLLADFLFREQLKTSLIDDPNALAGQRVVINKDQQSFVMIMLLYDVLEEMITNAGDGDVDLT